MFDVECPYCNAGQEINHDDGYGLEEGKHHPQECDVCGKTFVYFIDISIDYTTHKADCLNGEEHKYMETRTFPPEAPRMKCEMCGEEKPLTHQFTHYPLTDEQREIDNG